jgi:hypothetical protein
MKQNPLDPLPEETLVRLLTPPAGPTRAVLDTDTYNEIDDQFALAYASLADDIRLDAVYAAPFHNTRSNGPGDGMEKSYEEIERVLTRLDALGCRRPGTVLRGSTSFLSGPETPVDSPAAHDLVERAMSSQEPLYVLTIGAPTNIASAILMEPRIRERIVVVWLGGQPWYWHTASEFNLKQDPPASRILFDAGVPLMQIPCSDVSEHLNTTIPELQHHLAGRNALCDYLAETTAVYMNEREAMSKVIWDVSAIAWLRESSWIPSRLTPSPLLTTGLTWSFDDRRHLIRQAVDVRRDPVFRDLFGLLTDSPGRR